MQPGIDRVAGAALTPAQRRYVAIETAIAAVINAVLSLIFVFLIFGGRARVPAFGTDGVVLDAIPQTLMVSLMSIVVPGLLTAKRVRDGKVEGGPAPTAGAILSRGGIVAVLAALVLTALQFALLSLGPPDYPFGPVLAAKMLYGAVLGAVIARWGVRRILIGGRA
jgi:hypothetical protein